MLGLGVIEMNDGKRYLYDAMIQEDDEIDKLKIDEGLKIGIYYQITNPDYHDVKLEILINTKGTIDYLSSIISDKKYVDEIVEKLKDIFKGQKGKENNVVQFNKKG